ncbi:MAG: hypothetical protein HRU47_12865 [Verrucomicrobiales bacterium]|nr:hypothetical protein [Verrucomicrobiales bacterium]
MKITNAEGAIILTLFVAELKKRKRTFIIAVMPWSLALGLYWSLAIHLYLSLGGWPEMRGTRGFSSALLLHANIQYNYLMFLSLLTLFVCPVMFLLCLLIKRLKKLVIYPSMQILGGLLFLLQMLFAPDGYTDWLWG